MINWTEISGKLGYPSTKEMMIDLYIIRDKSWDEITLIIGAGTKIFICETSVYHKLTELGIKTDKEGRKDQLAQSLGYVDMRTLLKTEYTKHQSTIIVGEMVGKTCRTVWRWLKEYGISIRGRGWPHGRKRPEVIF